MEKEAMKRKSTGLQDEDIVKKAGKLDGKSEEPLQMQPENLEETKTHWERFGAIPKQLKLIERRNKTQQEIERLIGIQKEIEDLRKNIDTEALKFLDGCLGLSDVNYPVTFKDILKENYDKIIWKGSGRLSKCYKISDTAVCKFVEVARSSCNEYGSYLYVAYNEMAITSAIQQLRVNPINNCKSFTRLYNSWVIWDYPHPKIYPKLNPDTKYLFIGYEFEDAGSYPIKKQLKTEQIKSSVMQMLLALAVAENALQFEHRDLFLRNIMLKPTYEKEIAYTVDKVAYKVESRGIKLTIIDFYCSRLTTESEIHSVAFKKFDADLAKIIQNRWNGFFPKSNVVQAVEVIKKLLQSENDEFDFETLKDSENCMGLAEKLSSLDNWSGILTKV